MESDVADHMTRLKLKLLEKKLENECENLNNSESPFTRNYDNYGYALQSALRRRKDLLQQLRLPQQPATIIQQIPSYQPPLITQIASPQSFSVPRSGSIKEDMVEMMLMQNAQMHQIIMQNMMLKSLPPTYSPTSGYGVPMLQQGQQLTAPIPTRVEKSRPSTVHHHHYTSLGAPVIPSQSGFPMWPLVLQPGHSPQLEGFPSEVHNLPIPVNASHIMPPHRLLGLPSGL
ncbi:PREDICTED: uncharacterized protein C21orf58-like isoform X3 [Thamnophis sirtalis]|uniref:Uncharacterized protein C21orf58-like isoform X3 n=1 Tax=Thamnophis sirtalis TaxID=35019 RepID=A0A6I9YSP3_9SAUR|nr:PREDICTED: uncharacterized protein C21orf58-like isoform X3 [Thamnophis sirtalis]